MAKISAKFHKLQKTLIFSHKITFQKTFHFFQTTKATIWQKRQSSLFMYNIAILTLSNSHSKDSEAKFTPSLFFEKVIFCLCLIPSFEQTLSS